MNEKIRFFEEIASNAHVALNVVQYDGWLLRSAYGYTNRANSISVLYPSTIDFEKKITYCEEYYKKQNLPCVFKLTDDDVESSDFLEKRGYEVVTPTEEWISSYFLYGGITDVSKQDIFRQMLSKLQVVQSNRVALDMYTKLGYEKVYSYWYMKKETT